ncbi:glycosyltransferase family 2 protein [Microbacterium sp.]|uniref:glycosyltransferase family 2 protein n=1 Tax=Microbacterium sp. TaxID=51671 RepID=UPI0037C8DE6B
MKLSVITPSFNYARFLDAAMRSVRDGHAVVREHVISDGASTDGTVELLSANSSSVKWRSEPDKGQSDALNHALEMADGEYIAWLNADDFYIPGGLDAAIAYLDEHPEVDVVHGDTVLVDEHGVFIKPLFGYPTWFPILASRGCVIASTATVFRRSALPPAPWDVRLRYIMDWDLYLGIMRSGRKIVHLPILIAGMRIHDAQVSAERRTGDARDSSEHQIVRRKHQLGIYGKKPVRRLADVTHKVAKLVSTVWYRKRPYAASAIRVLDANGNVESAAVVHLRSRLYAAHRERTSYERG